MHFFYCIPKKVITEMKKRLENFVLPEVFKYARTTDIL